MGSRYSRHGRKWTFDERMRHNRRPKLGTPQFLSHQRKVPVSVVVLVFSWFRAVLFHQSEIKVNKMVLNFNWIFARGHQDHQPICLEEPEMRVSIFHIDIKSKIFQTNGKGMGIVSTIKWVELWIFHISTWSFHKQPFMFNISESITAFCASFWQSCIKKWINNELMSLSITVRCRIKCLILVMFAWFMHKIIVTPGSII